MKKTEIIIMSILLVLAFIVYKKTSHVSIVPGQYIITDEYGSNEISGNAYISGIVKGKVIHVSIDEAIRNARR